MAEEGRSGLGGPLPTKGLPHNLRPKTRSYPALVSIGPAVAQHTPSSWLYRVPGATGPSAPWRANY
jgi:hypothetical protein